MIKGGIDMKRYEIPMLTVEMMSREDVIATSAVVPTLQKGTFGVNDERTASFDSYF